MKKVALVCVVLGFGLASPAARADVIFNDFGPGQSFDTVNSKPVIGSPLDAPSARFSSSGNYSLTEIDVALAHTQGTNSAVVSLWTGGSAPGTELGSWYVSNQGAVGSNVPVTSITGITGITLNAGKDYFLQIAPGASDTVDNWDLNSIGDTGLVSINGNPALLSFLPAFELVGTIASVPEPSSLLVLSAGLVGLFSLRRWKAA